MKRIAISELEGATLNRAVLIAIGGELDEDLSHSGMVFGTWDDLANSERFDPGSDWSQCGPLIERYRLSIGLDSDENMRVQWVAAADEVRPFYMGDSLLTAACRAIVAAHNPSGYVDVPLGLVEGE
ncbi:MAG: phage protein NinX family protein [Alcanivorax sediminis]|uniref:phage protein NinX family protein n=1 Tax=Alcanivorax sediminis TaxID=2663008 RepID=UPI003C5C346D